MVMEAGDPSHRSTPGGEGMGVELERSQKDDRGRHSLQGTLPTQARNCLAIAVNRSLSLILIRRSDGFERGSLTELPAVC